MTTSKGIVDQSSGHGRGCSRERISAGTAKNFGSSLYSDYPDNITGFWCIGPVVHHGPESQLCACVYSDNVASIWSAATISALPPPATDATVLESSHRSKPADAPPLSPIVCVKQQHMYSRDDQRHQVDLNFIWDKEHDLIILKIYDHRMGRRLQQMLEDVRERHGHLTSWLCPEIKKALYVHWESKSLDRDATLAETFKYTYTLKENKERFVGQRYADHYYLRVLHVETGGRNLTISAKWGGRQWLCCFSHRSQYSLAQDRLSAVQEPCIRVGLFFTSSLQTSTSASATSKAVDLEEGIDLRLHVQELTQSLHDQAQKMKETQERYQKILTRMTDKDELRLEWREQLERLQRMK
ncbi:uncharacterized protein DS421_17g583420 [Arachis hypogaea]|nr:uncharacterized protein DS421_17g583420 [Arachis hypogaea]